MGLFDFLRRPATPQIAIDPKINFDPLFQRAVDNIYQTGNPSPTALQKHLRVGFVHACTLLDQMEAVGIVGPDEGRKPRKILLSKRQWLTIRPQCINSHCNHAASVSSEATQPERNVAPLCDYTPTAQITSGNISILSSEEMVVIMRNYHVVEEIRTKVKGVTFRNDDGTDRQTILRHCHAGDQLRFGFYRYQGAPAYTVVSDWGQLGNLSADLAEELAEMISRRKNKCLILGEILNISGGNRGESFGCNISLTIYEKNY